MPTFSKYACAKPIRMCVCCRARFSQKELCRFLVESSFLDDANHANNAQKIVKPFSHKSEKTISQNAKNGGKNGKIKKGQKGEKKGKSFYFCKECLSACLADDKQLTKAFARAVRGLPKNLVEIREIAQEWLALK